MPQTLLKLESEANGARQFEFGQNFRMNGLSKTNEIFLSLLCVYLCVEIKCEKRQFFVSEGCGWCGKPVEDSQGISSGLASFCSELCFSQSRRASFKKNKTCDWCRHVRHTVSYVDFQVN